MNPIRITVHGTSTTHPIPVDYQSAPFQLSLAVDGFIGVVAATAQYTFDNVRASGYNPATGNWFTDSVILGASSPASTAISAGPVTAIRFSNVGSGSFVGTILQSGP